MGTMIKSKLISIIAEKHAYLPEPHLNESINAIIEMMSHTLGSGGRIEIRGFGSFSLHFHPPRNAHNPKTGERVITQGKYSPHFKPGKQLRDNINASASQGIVIQSASDDDEK